MSRISRLVVGLTFLLLAPILKAQVNTLYSFAATQGSYTPITGGDLLYSGVFDDAITTWPVPTVFFNGTYYDTVRVSTNGFITFGTIVPLAANYVPISSSATYIGCASAFG